jgi:hypothetical protein
MEDFKQYDEPRTMFEVINTRFPNIETLTFKETSEYRLIFNALKDCHNLRMIQKRDMALVPEIVDWKNFFTQFPKYEAIGELRVQYLSYPPFNATESNLEPLKNAKITHLYAFDRTMRPFMQPIMTTVASTLTHIKLAPSFNNDNIPGALLKYFPETTNLIHLDVENGTYEGATLASLHDLIKRSPNLKTYIGAIHDGTAEALAEHCPLLEKICSTVSAHASIQGFSIVIRKFKHLRDLRVSHTLEPFCEETPPLTRFESFGSEQVNSSIPFLKSVKILHIKNKWEDHQAKELVKYCPLLEDVMLGHSVKAGTIKELVSACPRLRYIRCATKHKFPRVKNNSDVIDVEEIRKEAADKRPTKKARK